MLTSASSAWKAASYVAGDLGRRLRLEAGSDEHRVRPEVDALVAQVADVGDVLDVQDVDAVVQQGASDEVGQDVAAQVADVGVAVDGRAAGVHPDPSGLERFDRFDPAGQGVAEAEHGGPDWLRLGVHASDADGDPQRRNRIPGP